MMPELYPGSPTFNPLNRLSRRTLQAQKWLAQPCALLSVHFMSPGDAGSCLGIPDQVLSPLRTRQSNLHLAHRQVSVLLPELLHAQARETTLG